MSALLLVGAPFCLYGVALHAPWYLDDHLAIVENPLIRDLSEALVGVWRQRGVALLTFALNYRFGGLDVSGYHLLNIAIHACCGLLVWRLLRYLFRDREGVAFFGALLFLVHPLQTQAVSYLVQRMTSLAALFFLLAHVLFVRWGEERAAGGGGRVGLCYYGGALLCGALAVLSKENTAVLPATLWLFGYFFIPGLRSPRRLLVAVFPFAVVPLLVGLVMLWPVFGGAAQLAEITETQTLSTTAGNSPWLYFATQWSVLWVYLRLIVCPWGQAFDHAYPLVRSVWNAATLLSGGGLLLLLVGAWHWRTARPRLSFAVAWFFLTLAVESSIIPLDPLFEHRLYLPLFAAVVALGDCSERLRRPQLAGPAAILLVLGLALLTVQRNRLWNDPVALFSDNLRVAPQSERTLVNLSTAYIDRGRLTEAEELARRALAVNPGYLDALRNLARICAEQGRAAEGLVVLERALQLDHASPELYSIQARIYLQQGRFDLAEAALLKSLSFQSSVHTYNNLGVVNEALGHVAEAERYYRAAIALAPAERKAYANLYQLLQQGGRGAEAEEVASAARRYGLEL